MKRTLMLLAAGLITSILTACGAHAPTLPALTFPQQVAIACGAANGEIAILKGDGVFTGGAADTLTKTIQPAVTKVCAAGATVAKPDLQTLVNTTLPLVKTFVDSSSLARDKKNAADAGIDSAVLAFNVAVSLAPATLGGAATPSTTLDSAPLQ
ncbi:hypothetical protein [Paraburkholderia tagetis]|uniref:Lipoprotein n=1 Tax=Paraburkholderia tagetis TaxID=2913261 RepID=A0A9X1RNH9_9BURK|nr:hypothetical protein [Paraburkholderia tagetis]MCG5072303.1 hypothetical protein [Paraburkholderia tagetis]